MRVALKIGALPRPQAGRLDTAAMAYRNAFPTATAPDAWLPGGLPAVPVDTLPAEIRRRVLEAWSAALRD